MKTDDKLFSTTIDISDDTWAMAYSFKQNGNIIQQRGKKDEFVVVYSKHSDLLKSKDYLKNNFSKLNLDFDGLVSLMVRLNIVILNRSKWNESKCTCSTFLKNYICFHIIVVSVNENLLLIADKYKKIQIGLKKKPGRKSKAKKALEKQ